LVENWSFESKITKRQVSDAILNFAAILSNSQLAFLDKTTYYQQIDNNFFFSESRSMVYQLNFCSEKVYPTPSWILAAIMNLSPTFNFFQKK
jgi:hypothetical protein